MNYKVRNYKPDDFTMISSWWADSKEVGPIEAMLPPESTFILELNGVPTVCVTLYLTNAKAFCMADNLISNPAVKDREWRAKAVDLMNGFADGFARERGFERILCLTEKNALKRRYMELGYKPTLDGVTTFIKEVK